MEKQSLKVIIIVLSILSAVLFLVCIVNEFSWDESYNDLDQEWCESFNEQSDLINELLDYLKEYDDYDYWNEIEEIEILDCFGGG